jgi:threonine synthase
LVTENSIEKESNMSRPLRRSGLIEQYRDRMPIKSTTHPISLGEGNTPLIRLENIPRDIGRDVQLYVKYEGLNPTGSFKDRGMTVAITRAVEEGSGAVICASTGNTSASAAAYAARAGIKAFVVIPEGKIALGKLSQAIMHGATTLQIQGNFDEGLELVRQLVNEAPLTLVNSVNPYRLQGQKSAAFEIIDELGRAPDFHCLPVGNAGNITAYWMGYCEYSGFEGEMVQKASAECQQVSPYRVASEVENRPVMVGYQASGSAPFLRGQMVDDPETVATAIRIGHPVSWDYAWAASRESGGWFDEFDDDEILKTQRLLAQREGVFCEPASATSVAGALRDIQSGKIPEGSTVVCTLTGHGLKDPDIAIQQCADSMVSVDANLDAIKKAILDKL